MPDYPTQVPMLVVLPSLPFSGPDDTGTYLTGTERMGSCGIRMDAFGTWMIFSWFQSFMPFVESFVA
jgi:hypothetical protein